MESILLYQGIYFGIGLVYLLVISGIKGFVKQEWVFKDLVHLVFFPLSMANDLGYILGSFFDKEDEE